MRASRNQPLRASALILALGGAFYAGAVSAEGGFDMARDLPGIPIEATDPRARAAQEPIEAESVDDADDAITLDAPPLPQAEPLEQGQARRSSGGQDTLTVEPGRNQVVVVAKGHPNRIVVPFEHPKVRTVHAAEIEVSGSVIYVTTAQSSPVTLYITDDDEERYAISLTLVPRKVPPRSMTLEVAGFDAQAAMTQRIDPDKAGSWERAHPLRESVMRALHTVANGEIPDGYGLTNAVPASRMPVQCWDRATRKPIEGLFIGGGQRIEGRNFVVWVAAVINLSERAIHLEGPECYNDGVLAVALWPTPYLEPDESAELYVVTRRMEQPDPRARPSTLLGEPPRRPDEE